jgi:hypothetical protein
MGITRVFEYTESSIVERFQKAGVVDFDELKSLPTLFVQENQGPGIEPVARIGTLLEAKLVGRDVVLEYAFDDSIAGIPNSVAQRFAAELGISNTQFARTHWAVKNADLFRTLLRNAQPRRHKPKVFRLADIENIEPLLVSAMMPFQSSFDAVYVAIQDAAKGAGLRCRRADDIWEDPLVIQDVVSLIDRSKIVVCDCTGRNPNVFYEIGIAHTLGREVILITQSEQDIPFDLRHLRFVSYLNNAEGRRDLTNRLLARALDIAN